MYMSASILGLAWILHVQSQIRLVESQIGLGESQIGRAIFRPIRYWAWSEFGRWHIYVFTDTKWLIFFLLFFFPVGSLLHFVSQTINFNREKDKGKRNIKDRCAEFIRVRQCALEKFCITRIKLHFWRY
jgi:hypothetical protein